jgi:endonuclease V-like protein UPF0215 family
MKKQVRVMGIDDSPFSFQSDTTLVVGVVSRLPFYIEGIMRTECSVDGTDANQAILDMIERSRYREQLRLIMFDGVAVGGFNVVDISLLHESTGIPCATVTRELPDFERMRTALKLNFPDWQERLAVIRKNPLHKIGTAHKPLYAAVVGIDLDTLEEVLKACTVQGALPEPLRIAHLISSAMVLGESHGRA